MEIVTEVLEQILQGALSDRAKRAEWNRDAERAWRSYGCWVAQNAILRMTFPYSFRAR